MLVAPEVAIHLLAISEVVMGRVLRQAKAGEDKEVSRWQGLSEAELPLLGI